MSGVVGKGLSEMGWGETPGFFDSSLTPQLSVFLINIIVQ